MRTNKSQFAILGWLSKHPMSGYDIKKRFAKTASFHWSETNAQIYPMLKKLTENRMVRAKVDPNSGARQRHIYTITAKGLTHLENWLAAPTEWSTTRDEFMLKITMGHATDPTVIHEQLAHYLQKIEDQQALLADIKHHIQTDHEGRGDQPYLLMAYDQAETVLAAKQQWTKKTLRAFQQVHPNTC